MDRPILEGVWEFHLEAVRSSQPGRRMGEMEGEILDGLPCGGGHWTCHPQSPHCHQEVDGGKGDHRDPPLEEAHQGRSGAALEGLKDPG